MEKRSGLCSRVYVGVFLEKKKHQEILSRQKKIVPSTHMVQQLDKPQVPGTRGWALLVSYMNKTPPNLKGLFGYKGRSQRFAKVIFHSPPNKNWRPKSVWGPCFLPPKKKRRKGSSSRFVARKNDNPSSLSMFFSNDGSEFAVWCSKYMHTKITNVSSCPN